MKDLILKDLIESRVVADEYPGLAITEIQEVGFTRVSGKRIRRCREGERCYGHLHVTVAGEAMVLVNGRWVNLPAGSAYVVPQEANWAWRCDASAEKPWEVFFIRLRAKFSIPIPVERDTAYVIRKQDPTELLWTFKQLYRESLSKGRPAVIACLSELISFYAQELMDESEHHSRLADLWMTVARDLAHPWNVAALCREIAMSQEQLRLLCHRETGRSPMAQVTHLRMRRAAELLGSDNLNVQEIGFRVGYHNPFNFSLAFKRIYGLSPTHFRKSHDAQNSPAPEVGH